MKFILDKKTRELKTYNLCIDNKIGYQGENFTNALEIYIEDEKLWDKSIALEFEIGDKKYTTKTKLDIIGGLIYFLIPNSLLVEVGSIGFQVVIRETDGLEPEEVKIWKSNIKRVMVDPSINATEDVPSVLPDVLTLIAEISDRVDKVEEKIETISNEYLKKDLSILETTDLTQDRTQMSIFIDNNGTPTKTKVSDLLNTKIRTVDAVPNDLQNGDYIFLKIKDE